MMTSPAAIESCTPILRARDFYRESHGYTFRVIVDLHSIGSGITPITVASELKARGELGGEYTAGHIAEIASLFATVSNAPFHAEIIARLARFRDLIHVGGQLGQMGWEAGDLDQSTARAQELVAALEERRNREELAIETWHQFEAQAHDHIPVLIDQLWPEGAFGFIAAPPKKGKTWVALALAIAVATGRPLFGHFAIPTPRPVLYIALEGHRAALRARVGAIARGMGIDPDSDELNNLHWLYKPRGINLADRAWAERIRRAADKPDAALIAIDVMRASARLKENDQEAFGALRSNLQPITDDGRAIAMLHHNVKLSEISKERDPGERMSGSGAMYGALDVGIYITGSDEHATKLRLDFDLRDLATPPHLNIHLTGEGAGENGGYTYRDTATFQVVEDEVPETDLKAPVDEIYDWIVAQGGDVEAKYAKAHFEIGDSTFTRRLGRLMEMGVQYIGGRGKAARLVLSETPPDDDEQLPLDTAEVQPTASSAHEGTRPDEGTSPHNHAGSEKFSPPSTTNGMEELESGDMQGKSSAHDPPLFESAPTRARARDALLADAETYALEKAWREDSPAAAILSRYPNLKPADLEHATNLAVERAAREFA